MWNPCCCVAQRVEDMLEEVAEVEREIGELRPQVEAWRRKHQGECDMAGKREWHCGVA